MGDRGLSEVPGEAEDGGVEMGESPGELAGELCESSSRRVWATLLSCETMAAAPRRSATGNELSEAFAWSTSVPLPAS